MRTKEVNYNDNIDNIKHVLCYLITEKLLIILHQSRKKEFESSKRTT